MTPSQRLAFAAYSAAWWLAVPFVGLYLLWRGLLQREYRRHWGERFLGRGARLPAGAPRIWVHAVSVGETRAAQPLIERLARDLPEAVFVLSHMTPTGRAVGQSIVAALPGRVTQRYLAYDLPCAVARFLRETQPAVGVIMETEIWPNLMRAARQAALPMLLANARLSERSAARGLRLAALLKPAATAFHRIAAQSEADRMRLARWFDGPIDVTGNLKFDLGIDAERVRTGRALRERWGDRPVWLCASTREGEEALLLAAWKRRTSGSPMPILILVPRHPQRFDEVARLIEQAGHECRRRSRGQWTDPPPAAILLGDSMGEMAMYYAAADVALIGGSLRDFGAQNLIEACAVGTPVIVGPSTFNFAQATADALACGAALQVRDAGEVWAAMASLALDPGRLGAMRAAALQFAAAHRGATGRVAAIVHEVLRGHRHDS